jgi:class 3 adenylate cyclase
VLAWLRRPRRLRANLVASVSVDFMIIALILLPQVVWPRPGSLGLLRAADPAILLLAIVAAGVRLSRFALLVGAALMLALFGAVVALEALLGPVGAVHPGTTATWTLFLVGAAVLGYTIATRTRRLVFHGARTALVAERTRQRFGAYVSEEIAREVIDAEEITLGGRRQPVAVLFSDLRGFTRYSEQVPPEQLIAELNNYLDAMVSVIRSEGGVVDKFIGDAIMVVFGIPRPRPDDALRAVRTAAAMQQALARHNERRAAAGRPPLRHGIGVHFGPAVAGHVGNEDRLQFTVVGDVVNVASRLESATKAAGVAVLISEAAAAAARKADGEVPGLESRGRIELPGHDEDLEAHTLA